MSPFIRRVLKVWSIASWLALASVLAVSQFGAPTWLELPWSGFEDFVEGSDGSAYVDIEAYGRVLRYNKDGRFVASYESLGKGRGDTGLAVDTEGTLYFRAANAVYAYDSNWRLKARYVRSYEEERVWMLSADREPVHVSSPASPIVVPDRAVAPGEFLFVGGERRRPRSEFLCRDGSVLRKLGNSLIRTPSSGAEVARYRTPLLIAWAVFPFPGALGLAATVALVLLRDKRKTAGNEETRPRPSKDATAENARGFARLLAQEIRLYNEKSLREAVGRRRVYQELQDEIDRAWASFSARLGSAPTQQALFLDAVIEVLCAGDAEVLGEADGLPAFLRRAQGDLA